MGNGRVAYIVSIIIAAAFIYFAFTSGAFRSYALNSVENMNTSISLSQSIELFNRTRNLSEGAFVNWSLNSSNNNSVINGIRSRSRNTGNFIVNVKTLWSTINALNASVAGKNNYTSYVYNAINGTFRNITRS